MKATTLALLSCLIFVSLASLIAKSKKASCNQLKVGDKAPNFTLPNQDGTCVTLYNIQGKRAIYFYPMDSTPGCTKQACSLRDGFQDLKKEGITVLGISPDSESSHKKFIKNHDLPFTLLSDDKNEVAKLYGTAGLLFNSRWTFLVDKNNTIVCIIKDVTTKNHAAQITAGFKDAQSQ